MAFATINRNELLRTVVVGEVTSPELPSLNPYEVSADGAPFVPVGAGGVCYTVRVGMPALGWAADQVEPGASIAHPSPSANEALSVFACVGNAARVRSGAAAGAEGTVVGKHEAFHAYKHVLVHLADEVLEELLPGDTVRVAACGRGTSVEGFPEVACHSLGPELWQAWSPEALDGRLRIRVTHVLPPEVVGMGSGRVSAATSVALQTEAAGGLGDLRIGDLVAIREWDAAYYTGYHEDRLTIAVVTTGGSPSLGNGPATTVLLSGPSEQLEPVVDGGANLSELLELP
jgi:hypothetical protein